MSRPLRTSGGDEPLPVGVGQFVVAAQPAFQVEMAIGHGPKGRATARVVFLDCRGGPGSAMCGTVTVVVCADDHDVERIGVGVDPAEHVLVREIRRDADVIPTIPSNR